MNNLVSILAIIAVVVVAGWAIFSFMQNNNTGDTPGIGGGPGTNQNPRQSTLVRDLRVLLPEHGILASDHLQRLYDGQDTTETARRLEENSQKVADIMHALGGNREEFLTHWRAHIKGYEDYTNALKNNDRNGTSQARAGLSNHATEMGRMINQAIPGVPAAEATRLMEEHIDLTLSIIEAHARQDTSEQLRQITSATNQAIQFANVLITASEQSSR